MNDSDANDDCDTGEHDGGRGRTTEFPITRRGAIRSGAVVGSLGLLTGGGWSASATSEDDQFRSERVRRSSLQASLERKIDQADEDETLRLQIHTEPDDLDDAVEMVVDVGGDVRTSYHTLVIADVPAGRIARLADSTSIRLASEYIQPEVRDDIKPKIRGGDLPDDVEVPDLEKSTPSVLDESLPTSEGVEISGADELHDVDITGEGVTIAIIDTGFDVNNRQYEDQVLATLGREEGDEGFEDAYEVPGGHGDAVADIVATMAPEADLVLANTFTIEDFEFFDALDAIEDEHPEVAVVNYSVGHLADFRIDGLDPISLRIAAFTEKTDAIFVSSAGNSAAVENAWLYDPVAGYVPVPQNIGEVYDSRGPGVFEEGRRELLRFDAHFDEDLEVSTRLPLVTFDDVAVTTEHIGWTIVHWDADPIVDDQVYMARLYKTPETNRPLAASVTRKPWETIDVLGEYFTDDVWATMDVEDDAWRLTRVRGRPEIAPIEDVNPTLTLPEGQRYRIWNRAWREHPLEFRDEEGEALLSQATSGKFEDDDVVDWRDRGRLLEFTLTVELAESLDRYVSTEDDAIGGAVATELPPPIYLEVQRLKADEDHHFDVWASFGGVDIPTPWATDARSVGIPATSRDPNVLSVAAVQAVDLGLEDGETDLAYEKRAGDLKGYSSQGPTQDGRRGVDLAGSAHVSTNAYGPVEEVFGMNGTSAAAPHVTGAVGLLSQVEGDTAEIRDALFATGREIADPNVDDPGETNTEIGFGYLDVASALEELEVSTGASATLRPSR